MRDVEIYIDGQAIASLEDDGVEIEVFDESGSTLTGEITVAEIADDDSAAWKAGAVLAKMKP